MSALSLLLHDYVVVPREAHRPPHLPAGVQFVLDTIEGHSHEFKLAGHTKKQCAKAGARLSAWVEAVESFIKHPAPSSRLDGALLLRATLQHMDVAAFEPSVALLALLTRLCVKPSRAHTTRAVGAECLGSLLALGCRSSASARSACVGILDKGLVTSLLHTMSEQGGDHGGVLTAAVATAQALSLAMEVVPSLLRPFAARVTRTCVSLMDSPHDLLADAAARLLVSTTFAAGDRAPALLLESVACVEKLVTLAMPQLLDSSTAFETASGTAHGKHGSPPVLELSPLACEEALVLRRFQRLCGLITALLCPDMSAPTPIVVPVSRLLAFVEALLDVPFMSSSQARGMVADDADCLPALAIDTILPHLHVAVLHILTAVLQVTGPRILPQSRHVARLLGAAVSIATGDPKVFTGKRQNRASVVCNIRTPATMAAVRAGIQALGPGCAGIVAAPVLPRLLHVLRLLRQDIREQAEGANDPSARVRRSCVRRCLFVGW